MQLAQKTSFITLSDRADGKTSLVSILEKTPHWPVATVRKENYMRFAEGEEEWQITEISVVRDETKSSSDDA